MKKAVPDENNVLSLDIEQHIAKSMGVHTFHSETGHALILIRDDYQNLLDKMILTRKDKFQDTSHAVVSGTAGIGKSVFRWYLVWKWMNEDLGFSFQDIRVNAGKSFYIVEKDGTTKQIFNHLELLLRADASLALLDPCVLVEDKDFVFSMVIVTASPSSIVGQVGKVSLSEFMKHAIVFVMKLWTLDEVKKVKPDLDPDLLQKFSMQEGIETYCVPRWLNYRPDLIPGHIERCWTNVSKNALVDFFLKTRQDRHKSKDLPYRLCTVVEDGLNNWKVNGFISDYAAKTVYDWAEIATNLTRENFVTLLDHPLGAGLIGNWYQQWALDCLAAKIPITVSETELSKPASGQASYSRLIEYSFAHLETVDVSLPNARKGVKPSVNMVTGILYHPKCKVYPSIDAFGIAVTGELILLQFTKSLTHSPADWKDIRKIVEEGKKLRVKRVVLVYCSPSVDAFRTPKCPTLCEEVIVCKGSVSSDFFVNLTKSAGSAIRR